MRGLSILLWSLVGLASASTGAWLGGMMGSFWPQTVGATMAAGAAFGLLLRRTRLAAAAACTAAIVSLLAFLLGTVAISPLIAWPLAGLAIGLAALPMLKSKRAKIVAPLSAGVLGAAGFVGGAMLMAFIGLSLDDSQFVAKFMLAGAAGFGFLVLAGMRIATWSAGR